MDIVYVVSRRINSLMKRTIFKALSDALICRLDLIFGEETANAGTEATVPTLLIT